MILDADQWKNLLVMAVYQTPGKEIVLTNDKIAEFMNEFEKFEQTIFVKRLKDRVTLSLVSVKEAEHLARIFG